MPELKAKITPTFVDRLAETGPIPVTAYAPITNWGPGEIKEPVAAKPLKVALIGTAPSSRMLAPYNNPEWQIWACSPGNMGILPSADRWFELHDNLDWPEFGGSYGQKYVEWLKTLTIPVVMQNQRLVKGAQVFPKDEVIKFFGKRCDCFLTSSFAWMIALAIMEGAKEIKLYGIDMASPGEYATQRQGFYYWLEKAEERGVIVDAPYESDIMTAPALYGYDEVSPEGRKQMARWTEIKQRIAEGQNLIKQKEAELENAKDFVKHLSGASEDMEYQVLIKLSNRHLTPSPSPGR